MAVAATVFACVFTGLTLWTTLIAMDTRQAHDRLFAAGSAALTAMMWCLR